MDRARDAGSTVVLPDGRSVAIRRMTPADAPALGELYRGLPVEDRRMRFFTAFEPERSWFEQWASVSDGGGFGLVAVTKQPGDDRDVEVIVGDAGATLLPNGNVEAAFTVAREWRGGLGSRLFEATMTEARRRGVRNLELEVLLENAPMLGLIRKYRYGVLIHGYASARFVVGTHADGPAWAPNDDRQRVLVEIAGGWWGGEEGLHDSDVQVVVCPGPAPGRKCPATTGKECRLAHDADVIVMRLRNDNPETDAIRAAHWAHHPRPRIVTTLDAGDLGGRR